jgi:hypothetical protein
MSYKNPNFEIYAENCETLETLGPKIQNAHKIHFESIWRCTEGGRTLLSNFQPQHPSVTC